MIYSSFIIYLFDPFDMPPKKGVKRKERNVGKGEGDEKEAKKGRVEATSSSSDAKDHAEEGTVKKEGLKKCVKIESS